VLCAEAEYLKIKDPEPAQCAMGILTTGKIAITGDGQRNRMRIIRESKSENPNQNQITKGMADEGNYDQRKLV